LHMSQKFKQYESIVIINSSLHEDTLNRIINRCENIIIKSNGKLVETERWGKRRLAYPINKFQYGFYIIFHYEATPNLIAVLEREYRLNENILRFMTFVKDKRALRAYEKRKKLEADSAVLAKEAAEKAKEEAEKAETAEAGEIVETPPVELVETRETADGTVSEETAEATETDEASKDTTVQEDKGDTAAKPEESASDAQEEPETTADAVAAPEPSASTGADVEDFGEEQPETPEGAEQK